MIDVNFCKAYASRLKEAIAGINYNNVVTEPSQVVDLLRNRKKEDNFMLFMAIPDFYTVGDNVDNSKEQVACSIMVLAKTNYSAQNHDEYLQLMQDTLVAARAVKYKMIGDKLDYTAAGCQYMKQLNVGSINITPELHFAECNGWNIDFTFDNAQ